MAETKVAAELAFDAFIESHALKYNKAADCLSKDRDTLLAFYDFPAEHWKHLRTTDEMDKRFFSAEPKLRKSLQVHSFVRLRRGPFFRPGHRSRSRRAQGRSRLAAFAATARLGLDRPEHGGMLACNGDCIPGWHLPSGGTILGGRGRPRGEAWRIGCKRHQAALFCPAELRRSRAGFGRRGFHCVTKRS
jgi:hypothetical protein